MNIRDGCSSVDRERDLLGMRQKYLFTAMLHTFESATVVICASWTGEMRPLGCKMNMDTFFFPLKP